MITVHAPISLGKLIDKITILKIKALYIEGMVDKYFSIRFLNTISQPEQSSPDLLLLDEFVVALYYGEIDLKIDEKRHMKLI